MNMNYCCSTWKTSYFFALLYTLQRFFLKENSEWGQLKKKYHCCWVECRQFLSGFFSMKNEQRIKSKTWRHWPVKSTVFCCNVMSLFWNKCKSAQHFSRWIMNFWQVRAFIRICGEFVTVFYFCNFEKSLNNIGKEILYFHSAILCIFC